jgi:hypothetical protein
VALGSLVQSHAPDERSGDGAQGWNIDQLAGPHGPVVQYSCTRCSRNGTGTRMVCFGTLLGPEGPGERCLTSDFPPGAHAPASGRRRVAEWDRSSSNGLLTSRYATSADRLPPVP